MPTHRGKRKGRRQLKPFLGKPTPTRTTISGRAKLRLGTATERIGDESLTPLDSLYVHGYILISTANVAPHAESSRRQCMRRALRALIWVAEALKPEKDSESKTLESLENFNRRIRRIRRNPGMGIAALTH
ncbi:hypothetical protein [Ensifer canadensis]